MNEQADAAAGVASAGASCVGSEAAALERGGEDRDRDDREDPKGRAEAVEAAVGIVDREAERVVVVTARRYPLPGEGGGICPELCIAELSPPSRDFLLSDVPSQPVVLALNRGLPLRKTGDDRNVSLRSCSEQR